MKVGILTIHGGQNYGAFWQARSLREIIRGLGHDAEIVPYRGLRQVRTERSAWRRSSRGLWGSIRNWNRNRKWKRFYEELLGPAIVTDPLAVDWPQYEAVVVGSDVVWHFQSLSYGGTPAYFGIVPGEGPGRWISYAPSCGRADPTLLPAEYAAGLRGFAALSARDRATRDLVMRATQRDCEQVLDPTWLFDSDDVIDLEDTEPVLAVYNYARMSKDVVRTLRVFARRLGLQIHALGFRKSWADRNLLDLTPDQWVEALRRARCVVTGTFHGTLYSLRLGKVFGVVANENIASKITAPIETLGVEDRLVKDGPALVEVLQQQLESPPARIYERTRSLRKCSLDFLRNSLSQPHRSAEGLA